MRLVPASLFSPAWWRYALALLALACVGLAEAQISDINAAVNKAGRQRMLSQRMAKAYLQLGQQIDAERSRRVLETSVATFDRQLSELRAYAPTAEIKATYAELDKSWSAYRSLLTAELPNRDKARQVLAVSEQVLKLAHQGTQQLEAQGNSASGALVNLSGRQRMLSQRMAKFYQAQAWGIADAEAQQQMGAARREFAQALLELEAARVNTPAIREGLALVRQQWIFFDAALAARAVEGRAQTSVATSSERILEEMEGVVALYERLPR